MENKSKVYATISVITHGGAREFYRRCAIFSWQSCSVTYDSSRPGSAGVITDTVATPMA
jgi:hypothetical protein